MWGSLAGGRRAAEETAHHVPVLGQHAAACGGRARARGAAGARFAGSLRIHGGGAAGDAGHAPLAARRRAGWQLLGPERVRALVFVAVEGTAWTAALGDAALARSGQERLGCGARAAAGGPGLGTTVPIAAASSAPRAQLGVHVAVGLLRLARGGQGRGIDGRQLRQVAALQRVEAAELLAQGLAHGRSQSLGLLR